MAININTLALASNSNQNFPGIQGQSQTEQGEPQGLCSRLAYGTANCSKRFAHGIAAAGVLTPISTTISYLAQITGLIPELTQESIIRGTIENLKNRGMHKFDVEALLDAPCYLEEYTKQYNSHYSEWTPELHISPLTVKVQAVAVMGLDAPISEEILFRGLIQDLLLTRVPKYIIAKIAPGKETALDTRMAMAARIILTSALFSAAHLQNKGILSDSYVATQLVTTFVVGIGFGALKESKAGLLGSIGAHMAHNMLATAPILWSC